MSLQNNEGSVNNELDRLKEQNDMLREIIRKHVFGELEKYTFWEEKYKLIKSSLSNYLERRQGLRLSKEELTKISNM